MNLTHFEQVLVGVAAFYAACAVYVHHPRDTTARRRPRRGV